jgi:uncharacterized protein (TIGR03435 family)
MLFVMAKLIVLYAAVLVLLGGVDAGAQSSGEILPKFEVASIKPTPPSAGERNCVGVAQADAIRMSLPCATLKSLITSAFDLKSVAIEGAPAWADTRYSIEAKAKSAAGIEQMRLMLRALLADRFHLKVHRETPLRPAFVLVVAKGGPKMRAAESGSGQVLFSMAGKDKVLTGSMASMARLIPWLKSMTNERPIVDETGLTGAYDFKLQWLLDEDAPTVALFPALREQLGLQMEVRNAPVEILVIDHAEKPSPDE